jgi:PAS domain S-box-containing protein
MESQPSTILIIDDDKTSRETIEALLLGKGYSLAFAQSGLEGLTKAANIKPDLILLDVIMAGMDGFEVCRRLRSDLQLSEIPILMITSLDDREARLQGLEVGADDFITKPFDSIELRTRIRTITRLNRYRHIMEKRARFERAFEESPDGIIIADETTNIIRVNPMMLAIMGEPPGSESAFLGQSLCAFFAPPYVEACSLWLQRVLKHETQHAHIEAELVRRDGTSFVVEAAIGSIVWDGAPATQVCVRDITNRKRQEDELDRSRNTLALAYDATLLALVKVLDIRHKEPEGHTYRVTEMTVRMARALGISGDELVHIRRGALLHDIGKMGVPEHILFKPGLLSDEEWARMKQHPQFAYDWLSPIAYLRPSLDIPYCHHEKWDGTGYPRGLKGKEIPLAARIFALVDVWDSLRSERPYRAAWSEEKVRSHVRELVGNHFDPQVVETFLSVYSPFADISW